MSSTALVKSSKTKQDWSCQPVAYKFVIEQLYKLGATATHNIKSQFALVGTGITEAANEDPLLPHTKDGCKKTAELLLKMAWVRSGFNSTLRTGNLYGLYQIYKNDDVNQIYLQIPKSASLIAIDLIREKFLSNLRLNS